MPMWAGIDEAGYGPALGPLVVAGTAFIVPEPPADGEDLWAPLRDAVARHARGSDGRLVVNDSKVVYAGPLGLRRLEEGVLGFLHAGAAAAVRSGADLLSVLASGRPAEPEPHPWFRDAAALPLPQASNLSAVLSKASVLREALRRAGVRPLAVRAAVVMPPEFNRIVSRTRNKSLILFQKCGLLLQEMWRHVGEGESRVLVDRHGGRARYRRLLLDVFPHCRCDVLEEGDRCSAYRIRDDRHPGRTLRVTFQEGGDRRVLPTALASMVAKYVRELYMAAFNAYWQQRLDGLRPTAGYHGDAQRFLRDIGGVLEAEGVDASALVRVR
ncbi:MAG: hypothetical protein GXY85_11250 [Candidatus Brocadiaceae bacterium]|nr:hypothetical protein [Candidatus Brocadiaceae bacterium]